MTVYITTSRNPSTKTKALCNALSLVLPNSVYERRGGKNIEGIFGRAKLLGKSRVMLVYETSKIPSKICFMKVKAHSWEWIGEELPISKFRIYKTSGELPDELVASGERKGEFTKLLDIGNVEGSDSIRMGCSRKTLLFSYAKPLLRLELVQ